MAEDNDTSTAISASSLALTLAIYGSIMIVGWLIFECVRDKHRLTYSTRDRKADTRVPLSQASYGLFGWIKPTTSLSDEEVIEYCGLDALMFLRFQRLCIKVALGAVALSILVLPVYATGSNPDIKGEIDDLERFTMANVENGSARLWVSIISACAISFVTMYLVFLEYKLYVQRRHEFLQRPNAHQYSVLINDLPKKLRSNATLTKYMKHLFPNSVRCVYVALELKELEKNVAEREKARNQLEHALTYLSKTGTRLTHKEKKGGCCSSNKVDSIETYDALLEELNDKVLSSIREIEQRQHNLEHRLSAASEAVDVSAPSVKSKSNITDGGVYVEMEDSDNETPSKEEELTRGSAFVSFTSLQTAQMAQQLLQTSTPFEMAIASAPAIEDVEWKNIGLSHKMKSSWQMISNINTALIVFLWTIPTTFVSGLSRVESLKREIPFLESAIDDHPWIGGLLEQLAPLALVVMAALAPIIFRILSQKEGHSAVSNVEASLFTKLVYFQIIQTFLVAGVSGSLLSGLSDIINKPSSIAEILGKTIPGTSTFFMSVLVIQGCLGLTLELVRVVPVILAYLHRKIAPQITPRERENPWLFLKPLWFPDEFEQSKLLAEQFFVFLLIVVFAPIAPLVAYMALVYFALCDVVYRRQLLFVHDPSFNTAGVYWPRIFDAIILALLVGQITIIGVLGIKQSPAAVFLISLPILTLQFKSYIKTSLDRVSLHLPLNECCRVDRSRSGRDESAWAFLDNAYSQPAMQERDLMVPEHTEYHAEDTSTTRPSRSSV